MIMCNRDEAAADGMQSFINGVQVGNGNFSTTAGNINNTGHVVIGGSEHFANYITGQIAWAAMWQGLAWLQTGSKTEWQEVAEERHWKACDIWPQLSQGTGRPTSYARDDVAHMERFDPAVNKRVLIPVGENWPRVEEDEDSTGKFRGYHPEDDLTNLAFPSEDFSAWTRSAGDGISTDGAGAPNWETTADGIIGDTDDTQHYFSKTFTVSSATRYCLSCFVRAGDQDHVKLLAYSTSEGRYFNISTGVAGTLVNTPDASGIKGPYVDEDGNEFYRVWIEFTTGGVTEQCVIYSATADNDDTFAGDGSTINTWCWGMQLALASTTAGPKSYVKTVSAAVSRVNDDLEVDASDGNVGGTGGDKQLRLSADVLLPDEDLTSIGYIVTVSDGTGTNRAEVLATPAGDAGRTFGAASGTQWDITGSTDIADGERHHVEGRWKPNSAELYVDGSSEGTPDTSCSPPDVTQMNIGAAFNATGQPNCLVANVTAWQELEVEAAVDAPVITAPAAGVLLNVSAVAEADAPVLTAPDAAVSPGAVSVAAPADAPVITAPDAAVSPGAVQAVAEVVAKSFATVAAAVQAGAVSMTAQVVSKALATIDAAVTVGPVTVPAPADAPVITAPDAGVAVGAVAVPAPADAPVITAPDAGAVAEGGPQLITAEVDAPVATANPATVSPGPVTVPAPADAPVVTANPTEVSPGAVSVPAEVDAPVATANPATVDAPISVEAASDAPVVTAPDAAVSPGPVNVAAPADAPVVTAPDAAVSPGAVQITAEVDAPVITAPDAAVSPGAVLVAAGAKALSMVTNAAGAVALAGFFVGVTVVARAFTAISPAVEDPFPDPSVFSATDALFIAPTTTPLAFTAPVTSTALDDLEAPTGTAIGFQKHLTKVGS
jgi:hypothetical protein